LNQRAGKIDPGDKKPLQKKGANLAKPQLQVDDDIRRGGKSRAIPMKKKRREIVLW